MAPQIPTGTPRNDPNRLANTEAQLFAAPQGNSSDCEEAIAVHAAMNNPTGVKIVRPAIITLEIFENLFFIVGTIAASPAGKEISRSDDDYACDSAN